MSRRATKFKPIETGSRSNKAAAGYARHYQTEVSHAVSEPSLADLTNDVPIVKARRPQPMSSSSQKPFRFLDLPYELRAEVFRYYFATAGSVLDLDPINFRRYLPKLNILRTCRVFSQEASQCFYSIHPVRIFPCHSGKFAKAKRPLLARLKPSQRASLTTLELRLGPHWSKPPRGWVVNPELGLADCADVRMLTVFIECDPGSDTFRGYRQPNQFFERFAKGLLEGVLDGLPHVNAVQFDANPSVKKSGALLRGLLASVRARDLRLAWGPERGWTDAEDEERPPFLNLNAPLPKTLDAQLNSLSLSRLEADESTED